MATFSYSEQTNFDNVLISAIMGQLQYLLKA